VQVAIGHEFAKDTPQLIQASCVCTFFGKFLQQSLDGVCRFRGRRLFRHGQVAINFVRRNENVEEK
jgi:hypothetical protein